MQRAPYLATPHVAHFTAWLGEQLCNGIGPIVFPNVPGVAHPPWTNIAPALDNYAWPLSTVTVPLGTNHGEPIILPARSRLKKNNKELARMEAGLSTALMAGNHAHLLDWMIAVFYWGGVRHRNEDWATNHQSLLVEVGDVRDALAPLANDDPAALGLPGGFRFNSGLVKVYSLLHDSLIIYDSRVALALAWLVLAWADSNQILDPHEFLHFRQPAGRQRPVPRRNLFRGTYNRSSTHLTWAIRATWIIEAAITHADTRYALSPNRGLRTRLREAEAALFMLGE